MTLTLVLMLGLSVQSYASPDDGNFVQVELGSGRPGAAVLGHHARSSVTFGPGNYHNLTYLPDRPKCIAELYYEKNCEKGTTKSFDTKTRLDIKRRDWARMGKKENDWWSMSINSPYCKFVLLKDYDHYGYQQDVWIGNVSNATYHGYEGPATKTMKNTGLGYQQNLDKSKPMHVNTEQDCYNFFDDLQGDVAGITIQATQCLVCPETHYNFGCLGSWPGRCRPRKSCPDGEWNSATSNFENRECSPCRSCPHGEYLLGCEGQKQGTCEKCKSDTNCKAGEYWADCKGQNPGACKNGRKRIEHLQKQLKQCEEGSPAEEED